MTWTEDPGFWVRRASAVVLIPAIAKNDYNGIDLFAIADRLLDDEHDLVRKGYGWMLKVLSRVDPGSVENIALKIMKKCRGLPIAMPLKNSKKKPKTN